jgi:Amt family ammonium transporter
MHQVWNQLAGVAATVALAGVGTFIILKLVDATVGLRVDQEDESLGLDLSQHGERAYNE